MKKIWLISVYNKDIHMRDHYLVKESTKKGINALLKNSDNDLDVRTVHYIAELTRFVRLKKPVVFVTDEQYLQYIEQ